MVRGISLLEYIDKSRNKTLLIEYANYIIYHDWEETRVKFQKIKLKYLTFGKINYYKNTYHTKSIGLSRGNKLGNKAFIISEENKEDFENSIINENSKNIKYTAFHEDDEFNSFNTLTKQEKFDDDEIEELLDENIIKENIDIVETL